MIGYSTGDQFETHADMMVAQSSNFRVGSSFEQLNTEPAAGDMSAITQESMMGQRTLSEKLPGKDVQVVNQQTADTRDLDRRTPKPLPVVPSHSIAPHNPNPFGGGYTIRPGERLSMSDEQSDLPAVGQQYAMMEGTKIPGVNMIRGGEGFGGGFSPAANRNNPTPKEGETWHPQNPGGPGQINPSKYEEAISQQSWDKMMKSNRPEVPEIYPGRKPGSNEGQLKILKNKPADVVPLKPKE